MHSKNYPGETARTPKREDVKNNQRKKGPTYKGMMILTLGFSKTTIYTGIKSPKLRIRCMLGYLIKGALLTDKRSYTAQAKLLKAGKDFKFV